MTIFDVVFRPAALPLVVVEELLYGYQQIECGGSPEVVRVERQVRNQQFREFSNKTSVRNVQLLVKPPYPYGLLLVFHHLYPLLQVGYVPHYDVIASAVPSQRLFVKRYDLFSDIRYLGSDIVVQVHY